MKDRSKIIKIGGDVFGDKMRLSFTDLPLEEQRKHEAAILAAGSLHRNPQPFFYPH